MSCNLEFKLFSSLYTCICKYSCLKFGRKGTRFAQNVTSVSNLEYDRLDIHIIVNTPTFSELK